MFYVLTPAGYAGPYKTRGEAEAASLGFPVVKVDNIPKVRDGRPTA